MLSFDISDKKIRIVKGDASSGKIKIAGAMSIDVPDGVIINGFIQELSKAVTVISERLRDNRFTDKEAVVTLSSSQIVFREFNIPKGKGNALYSMIKSQIQNDMGLSENYNITYTIVGETKENNASVYKILAAACPNDIVLGITRLFNMLSLPIRSIAINCNSISRIVLSDPRNSQRMPLLAIQVDSNFLNLNLYENNHLAFSRVVPISKEDYNSDDYVYQALNENVFRMIQFNRARGSSVGIKDVIFYGDVSDYIKLTRSIEQQDVKTHILSVPQTITGYERFEFALYANAIGAMMKGKKELERTNLLEIESTVSKEKVSGGILKSIISTFLVSAIIAGGVFGYFKWQEIDNKNKRDDIIAENESPKVKKQLQTLADDEAKLASTQSFVYRLIGSSKALASNKVVNKAIMDELRGCMKEGQPDELGHIKEFSYKGGLITMKIECPNKDFPVKIVEDINTKENYYAYGYSGINRKESEGKVTFETTISVQLKEGTIE